MWPLTTRLASSLAGSNHEVVNKVEVLQSGDVVLTIVGDTVADPATGADTGLVDGTVDVDRTTVRRRATITLADVTGLLQPADVGDIFLPLRTELRPHRGLMYADRTVETDPADREYVPLGTLVVASVRAEWPTITLTCYDRMWLLDRLRFATPYTIAKSAVITDALAALITSRMPAGRGDVAFPGTDHTTGLIVWDEQDSPAEKAHDLAEAAGLMLYTDQMGVFTAKAEPTTGDDAVWSYVEGAASMLMPWPTEELSGAEAYNAVVATGEPQDGTAPVYGYAENSNPSSALYRPDVGAITYFFSSPLLTTTAQANLAAQTILTKQGLSDVTVIAGVVNPALDSGDVIYVQASQPAGMATQLIVDSFSVPLRGGGPQQITTRARVIQ